MQESCLSLGIHPGRGTGSGFHSQGEKPCTQMVSRKLTPLESMILPQKKKDFSGFLGHTFLGLGTMLRYTFLPVCAYRESKTMADYNIVHPNTRYF